MLPEQFLKNMENLLGEEYPAFLESFSEESSRGLRVNTIKTDVEAFQRGGYFSLERVPWTENGFYTGGTDRPGKSPLHAAGVYYIQEPSAMAPAVFLEARPGDRVLDLCAAPGGKTTQIADSMRGEGILISNEIHPARAQILSENVERMGLENVIVTNETPERLAAVFTGYFDKILVDAPCSGEGMFRKSEEARAEWSPENVALCAERQDGILDCAAKMLRPGGRLVYSTCTFAPEEDEGTVSRFLERHPDFSIRQIKLPEGFWGGQKEWVANPAAGLEYTARLMPHRLKGEGHYLAVLGRAGEDGFSAKGKNGTEKSIPEREYSLFSEFQEQYLSGRDFAGTYLRYGEQLYLGMCEMPSLKGLKALRPGLHLGTFKKNRFEPSHALALALKPEEAKQVVEVSFSEAEQYISGMTITVNTQAKGWCLVCVDGYSLGWGKVTGNVMKNHYPKGLRIPMAD